MEVAGKPLLEHVILKLKHQGFQHIVVNVHHFGKMIIDFLRVSDNFGLDIRVIYLAVELTNIFKGVLGHILIKKGTWINNMVG